MIPGCSKNAAADKPTPTVISETHEGNNSGDVEDGSAPGNTSDNVDIDLTAMSSTMIFAEVQNMMLSPDEFLGKTIKMSGKYSPIFYEVTENFYHYVIIPDATACCEQGLEFIWEGDHSYPLDYPREQTEIEIVGVFSSYEELDITYYYIKTDSLSVLA